MPIPPRQYPLVVVDLDGASATRTAQKALQALPCRFVASKDMADVPDLLSEQEPAVLLLCGGADQEIKQLLAFIRAPGLERRPLLAVATKANLDTPRNSIREWILHITPPFDWAEIAEQLQRLIETECLERDRHHMTSLLHLGRCALIRIHSATQQYEASSLVHDLLGIAQQGDRRANKTAAGTEHWQKLLTHCIEPARHVAGDLISVALTDGEAFETEIEVQLDRAHRRRMRLTGRSTNQSSAAPESVEILLQDITPQTGRTTGDAVDRMLETTLGQGKRDRVMQTLIRAITDQSQGSVLLVRLQGLADLYRHHGFRDGGALLRDFAVALEDSVAGDAALFRVDSRKSLAILHLSGGEFVAFVPGVIDDRHLAGTITRLFGGAEQVLRTSDRMTTLELKCGVASWPRDGESPDEVLGAAYQASQYFALKDMQAPANNPTSNMMIAVVRARGQARLEAELHNVIDLGELELHYQPKVSMADGRVSGFEALMRWRHGKDYVPPAIFIPIAERTGLITELGTWAIQQAVSQIAAWRAQGLGQIPVAVNVSTQQFGNSNLVEIIRDACRRQLVDTRFLQIEVTESLLIDDADAAMKVLQDIRKLGCSIALDDFGTGYSSLSYLRQLPLDTLKIDRSFTNGITPDATNLNLVYSIIAIARSLNLKTVAEGIASPLHWNMLEKWHCDDVQGYLISPPVPAQQVPGMWQHGAWDRNQQRFVTQTSSARFG